MEVSIIVGCLSSIEFKTKVAMTIDSSDRHPEFSGTSKRFSVGKNIEYFFSIRLRFVL